MPAEEDLWDAIRCEAESAASHEPLLASFLHATILHHSRMQDALSFHLGEKLASASVAAMLVRELIDQTLQQQPSIVATIREDLSAIRERDPASQGLLAPFLYFKGFHALQSYRVAHQLWRQDRRELALHLQSRISEVFAVDIHPAARVGGGILMDHGTSVVIGETAVVEDNVSLLHEVTLGGTGKEIGDRHPKVREGVLIGAGAKILGNVEIGAGSKIGAGSVVLRSVPPGCTAAGVPAKIIGKCAVAQPSRDMDQHLGHDGDGI